MRLGGLIRFIPVSIVIGFTNGIAVLILLSQMKDFLGLDITMPDEFFTRMRTIAANIDAGRRRSRVAVAMACLAVLWLWPKAITTEGQALEAEDHAAGARGEAHSRCPTARSPTPCAAAAPS